MLFGKIIKCSSNLRLMQNVTHCDADSRYSLNRLKPIFVCACKHAPCKVFKELWVELWLYLCYQTYGAYQISKYMRLQIFFILDIVYR